MEKILSAGQNTLLVFLALKLDLQSTRWLMRSGNKEINLKELTLQTMKDHCRNKFCYKSYMDMEPVTLQYVLFDQNVRSGYKKL